MFTDTIIIYQRSFINDLIFEIPIFQYELISGAVKLVDFATHYIGYYADNNRTLYITGIYRDGAPYVIFSGFHSSLNGKTLLVTCDNPNIGFTSKYFTVSYLSTSGDWDFCNITGGCYGEHLWGVDITHSYLPKGTYNISFIVGKQKYAIKLIKTF